MTAELLAAIAPLDWSHRAECRGLDPDLFHPEVGGSSEPAKAVCARCPVRTECLDHAIRTGETVGIWGGTSAAERRKLRRQWADDHGINLMAEMKRRPIDHGTMTGWRRCCEEPGGACAPCRDAYSRWMEYAPKWEGAA